jgi:RNA recognition motif-containing protein
MAQKLFVGNLNWRTTDEELQSLFEQFGSIQEAFIVKERETGRSRGFGFVTFETAEEAESAMNELDGTDFGGRDIGVRIAEEKKPRRDNDRSNHGGGSRW